MDFVHSDKIKQAENRTFKQGQPVVIFAYNGKEQKIKADQDNTEEEKEGEWPADEDVCLYIPVAVGKMLSGGEIEGHNVDSIYKGLPKKGKAV